MGLIRQFTRAGARDLGTNIWTRPPAAAVRRLEIRSPVELPNCSKSTLRSILKQAGRGPGFGGSWETLRADRTSQTNSPARGRFQVAYIQSYGISEDQVMIEEWRVRYVDRFTPEGVARLSDDVVQLAYAAIPRASPILAAPDDDEDLFEWQAEMRDLMRENVPALNSLSDVELDLAFAVAIGME